MKDLELEVQVVGLEEVKELISLLQEHYDSLPKELQEKLDNARSYAEDVQAALDDGSFSDAYDAASDAESEADYDDY